MPLTVHDIGYCPPGLQARLLDLVSGELAAVEAAVGRPLNLAVFGLSTRTVSPHRRDSVVLAEVFRRGEDRFELLVNPAALEGLGTAKEDPTWRGRAFRQAQDTWLQVLLQRHPITTRVQVYAVRRMPAWRQSWAAVLARDSHPRAVTLFRRFSRFGRFREWVLGGLLLSSSEVAAGVEPLRTLLAHEMGHVWYEMAYLGWGADREDALVRTVASLPQPVTARGISGDHEAAAEAWALGRVAPGLLLRRPDLVVWLEDGGAVILQDQSPNEKRRP